MKTYWETGGIAPCILCLGPRWRWVVSFTPLLLYSRERTPVPTGWMLFWRRKFVDIVVRDNRELWIKKSMPIFSLDGYCEAIGSGRQEEGPFSFTSLPLRMFDLDYALTHATRLRVRFPAQNQFLAQLIMEADGLYSDRLTKFWTCVVLGVDTCLLWPWS